MLDMVTAANVPTSPNAQAGLEVRALRLNGPVRPLIDQVNLSLPQSGVTVFMGPNGAGKSVLLRLLHGLIPADEGEILWSGEAVSPAAMRRQAMVFQKPVLLRRSVAANVDFVLRGRGHRDASKRTAILSKVGLSDLADQPARRLSGGEQQRLALARALVGNPEVLMMDEPTANLDPAATQMIEDIVRDVAAQGTKVLFVTHDIGQARRLADDVVFLHQGRLSEHSPAPDFFDTPQNDAARAYLAGQIVT